MQVKMLPANRKKPKQRAGGLAYWPQSRRKQNLLFRKDAVSPGSAHYFSTISTIPMAAFMKNATRLPPMAGAGAGAAVRR